MSNPTSKEIKSGGLAQYFVEHREVSWLILIGILIWGAVAYTRLGQQEDPTIPTRVAQLVTTFPGATASKVEELLTNLSKGRFRNSNPSRKSNPCPVPASQLSPSSWHPIRRRLTTSNGIN